jgi:hypothetical protein
LSACIGILPPRRASTPSFESRDGRLSYNSAWRWLVVLSAPTPAFKTRAYRTLDETAMRILRKRPDPGRRAFDIAPLFA